MKETFRDALHLNKANLEKLALVNSIIEDYASQGYRMTLRQLYYQLFSRGFIPNDDREYKKLGGLLVKGRMAGVVDWDAIEDRTRRPYLPYWVDGIKPALQDTIDQYRLDRMKGQDVYVELWVEKDALSGVLRKVTSLYHINLIVNRGYSSCSAMYQAFDRFRGAMASHKEIIILYLGDHDPSGLDMIRDIDDRILEFGADVEVKHIALTNAQIKKYKPPPNPAKVDDPRANWYIDKYGTASWEVDALPPDVLHSLVKTQIEDLIDLTILEDQLIKEKEHKKKLIKFMSKF